MVRYHPHVSLGVLCNCKLTLSNLPNFGVLNAIMFIPLHQTTGLIPHHMFQAPRDHPREEDKTTSFLESLLCYLRSTLMRDDMKQKIRLRTLVAFKQIFLC